MKLQFLTLLISFPIFLFSQTQDSILVAHEVDSLMEESRKLFQEQKFEEALKIIEIAKDKAASTIGTNTIPYANCLLNQGRILYYIGRYSDAEEPYLESIRILEEKLGREHRQFASALNSLGALYKEMGQYSKAEPLFIESRDIRAKVLGKENVYYALSIGNLADLYRTLEKYTEAEPLYLESMDIWAKVKGKKAMNYGLNLHGLAYMYLEMGYYDRAKSRFLEAIDIFEKTFGKFSLDYAMLLSDFGDLYAKMGSYMTAEQLLLDAKDILEKTNNTTHPNYAIALFKLANLYLDMGAFSKAEPFFLESLDIWAKVLGKDHLYYATGLNNLAILYMEEGEYSRAEKLYLEAKDIATNKLGKEGSRYGLALQNLAVLYKRMGELKKAKDLLLEAQPIWENTIGKLHPDYATLLNDLGVLYLELEDYEKAEPLFLEAIEIQTNILGKQHPSYAMSLSNLSILYWETGRLSEAKRVFLELNELCRHFVEEAALYSSENQFLAYLHTFERYFNQLQSFAEFNSDSELNQACFDNALFYRGHLLENFRRLTRSVSDADSLSRETYARWQGCRRRLATEYAKPFSERQYVTKVEAEAEVYEKLLTQNLPIFAGAFSAPPWQEIQVNLKPGEAAIEFIYYRKYDPEATESFQYAALVLLPDTDGPVFVPLCEQKQLDSLLGKEGVSEDFFIKNLYFDLRKGGETPLYIYIWKPIEHLLKGVNKIWYAPAGDLYRLNLAAIQPGLSSGRLGNQYQLIRVNSTRQISQSYPYKSAIPNATLLGNIQYSMDTTAYRQAVVSLPNPVIQNELQENYFQYDSGKKPGFRGNDDLWRNLEFSATEVDQVNKFLKEAGFQTEILQGFEANEEAFKQIGKSLNSGSPRILHISTHGFFYPDLVQDTIAAKQDLFGAVFKMSEHPLLRSGLILAGANYAWENQHPYKNFDDGILTAYEISQMDLSNTELVVLSACETGLGDIKGHEGVYGLQRAFKIAGVKYILMSLWQVSDEASSKLMSAFYRNYLIEKMPIHQALEVAQKWLQKQKGYNNPYFWAGFVLIE